MRRKALMLLLVLYSLALAVALTLPLATLGATAAMSSAFASNSLRHRLAAESLVALMPELLAGHDDLVLGLDRANRAEIAITVGSVEVQAVIQDDSAKLPLAALRDSRAAHAVRTAMSILGTQLVLPDLILRDDPASIFCLDDLFVEPSDSGLFGNGKHTRCWSNFVTPLGEGVNVFRADSRVLEALLYDIRPGLGRRIELARTKGQPLTAILSDLELSQSQLAIAQQRLISDARRYSVLIRTSLGSDVRRRYVICTVDSPPAIVLSWEVSP